MINKEELVEWAEFCDNYYGTPKSYIEDKINKGKDVILEIEVQGALQVKNISRSYFNFYNSSKFN